MNHKTLRKKT